MTDDGESAERSVIELALSLIEKMDDRDRRYRELNEHIRDLMPDFPTYLRLIDDDLGDALFDLLDSILGDKAANYFFYEARHLEGGGAIIENGVEWPLRTVADLRAYVMRKMDQ